MFALEISVSIVKNFLLFVFHTVHHFFFSIIDCQEFSTVCLSYSASLLFFNKLNFRFDIREKRVVSLLEIFVLIVKNFYCFSFRGAHFLLFAKKISRN